MFYYIIQKRLWLSLKSVSNLWWTTSLVNILIMWLKPGKQRTLNPEPIHLREIVSAQVYRNSCLTFTNALRDKIVQVNYLIENCQYESTGYDVCEISHLEQDDKYAKILAALEALRDPVPNLRYEQRSLDVDMLQGFKTLHGIPDMSGEELQLWKNSAFFKEINATALSVMTDVVSHKIGLTGHDGECVISLQFCYMLCLYSLLCILLLFVII